MYKVMSRKFWEYKFKKTLFEEVGFDSNKIDDYFVGYFLPNGLFYIHSTHDSKEIAEDRVHYLNGGSK